jgi:predicted alpha/beta-fold hydrolase
MTSARVPESSRRVERSTGRTTRHRGFSPSAWAPGAHAQTLLARLLRGGAALPYRRERLFTPDDDFLDMDWGPEPGPEAPIVLVLHGLEGSSRRGYVRNVCRELLTRGLQPVALNFRGCSGESNLRATFYHSGLTEDPALVLRILRERYPGRRIGAVGFSLGGKILLKLMGERDDGGRELLDAAVAMSVPYDLSAGCSLLERSFMGRAYTAYFLKSLKGKLRGKEERLAAQLDLHAAYDTRTLRSFDDLVTAPLHGFDDAEHYYHASSSSRFLPGVSVPTLLLHATDDPFLPASAIPSLQVAENPHIEMSLETKGGHVGFLEGAPWRPRFWADERTADFLADLLLRPSHGAPRAL